jgi:AsmA family protein
MFKRQRGYSFPRYLLFLVSALVLIAVGFALGEAAGWPFLASPIESQLSKALNRSVSLSKGSFKIKFLGSLRVEIANLQVAPPEWSKAPFMIEAKDVAATFKYADIWAAYKGERLHVVKLRATIFNSNLERLADGRVSWQLRKLATTPPPVPSIDEMAVAQGVLKYSDEVVDLRLNANVSANVVDKQLNAKGTGLYRRLPLTFDVTSSNTLPWESTKVTEKRIGLKADATVGRAVLVFNGSVASVTSLSDVQGKFALSGPSLAAVGDPMGVTLPTTAAFRATGNISKNFDEWNLLLTDMRIGSSRLNGEFKFANELDKRKLSGKLSGSHLTLADLGPAIGRNVSDTGRKKTGKVLPARPFDLAALRIMDANVLIDIQEIDLNTTLLEPLKPLKAHLQLIEGVLTISQIQATTSQGGIQGTIQLDGRANKALWTAALQWQAIRLEQWLKLAKRNGQPPYVSGQLNGSLLLTGVGVSTAEILGSLQGGAKAQVKNGSVSHLLVEAAGLDLAQAIGVFIKGDDALIITCAVTDLAVAKGVFKPRLMVVDTKDSAIWIDGDLSLATEALNLKAIVAPKDFSPFALRAPILVTGSFSQPKVSIDKGALGVKVGSALLLGLLNPLAALLPFIDMGDREKAKTATGGCEDLAKKAASKR